MRGERRHWSVPVDKAGVRAWGDEPADVDGEALAGVLATERSEVWAGREGMAVGVDVVVRRVGVREIYITSIGDQIWRRHVFMQE